MLIRGLHFINSTAVSRRCIRQLLIQSATYCCKFGIQFTTNGCEVFVMTLGSLCLRGLFGRQRALQASDCVCLLLRIACDGASQFSKHCIVFLVV